MAPIIHTVNLCKVYAVGKERVVALNDVSISIEKGEFCCIVGQSGSGKSTLLNQLAGLEKPTRGKVFNYIARIFSGASSIINNVNVIYQSFRTFLIDVSYINHMLV